MKKYNLILTASLIGALAVSTAAFAKPEVKQPEQHHIEQPAKAAAKAKAPEVHAPEKKTVKEQAPAKLAPAKHEAEEKAHVAPVKHEVKQKAPAKPVPVKHEPQKKAVGPKKVSHKSTKENEIIAIAAALLKLCS